MRCVLKKTLITFFSILVIGFVVGCADETNNNVNQSDNNNVNQSENNEEKDKVNEEEVQENNENEEEAHEPVTISFQVHWKEEMFSERVKDPLEGAYPWITVEQVESRRKRENLEEVFAKGISPDIFREVAIEDLEYFEIDYDLDELIEEYDYDLSHIDPVYLESIRSLDQDGRLLGLPFEITNIALFYNKDIFDRFGQPYPSDDMTWDETLDLAEKLTGELDGTYYRGLDISGGHLNVPLKQLSVNLTDPETGEVSLRQPEVLQYFDLIDRILDIQSKDGDEFARGFSYFEAERTTAMFLASVKGPDWWEENEDLNASIASVPVWDKDNPLAPRADYKLVAVSINPDSEHKEEAFRAITYFTEKEHQTRWARSGMGLSTNDPEVLDQYLQDHESLVNDHNAKAIFNHPKATPPNPISRWDNYVDFDLKERYAEEGLERNEYLRIIEEESEAKIKAAMGKE